MAVRVRARLLRGDGGRFPREIDGDGLGLVIVAPKRFVGFNEELLDTFALGLRDGRPGYHEESLGIILKDAA